MLNTAAHTPEPGTEDHWRGRSVLVTGATGFIGAHLVRRLGALGAEVHAVSRRPHVRHGERVRQGEGARPGGASVDPVWHVADVGDARAVGELVEKSRPDVVFHLASEVAGARDRRLVLPMMRANLASVVNLLTAVSETPGTRLVLAGSSEEPRAEEGETVPSSPYAVAKWAAAGYARMFHRLWDVPVVNLRIGMVYGPGQADTRKLVPYVTLALLRGEAPELSSGTRELDWIHVDDVVDAFLAAARADGAAGRDFDIGSGTRTSIRDTVELLARIVGSSVRPRYGAIGDRALDSARIADLVPAADVLGWCPRVELEAGLRQTVDWYARPL
ncbi:nucleoside-diphosphate-sugar epimerase [Streptosporangium becharense]|uniref:Nucleoside-diphosphate-sugar epimerase n=1 Tax=Streptosporangium becharense TaxID=1816182 RepID=A0A7W9IFS8_9ACTN|nr:NAD-dependent epimerase/dehydratase family protein [Streptosporangium becharense]MBB2909119.1 nucleoside-diphosphate-sugar epimerase [Streptosporangium becharense]MBB5819862.1 nucleoside-diphosphate-sugar epimerase [Streptosporangium becharense]